MGVINVTPDSFSDGGQFFAPDAAIEQGLRLVEEGAHILDIGGESTRPGAEEISTEQQLARVLPVISALSEQIDIPISIDTSNAEVMRLAVEAGAGLINDVRALRENGALDVAINANVPVCLMHMQGQPRTMQAEPHYDDVVKEVAEFLEARANALIEAGFDANKIILDPGFGFGKTVAHNLTLLANLDALAALGYPVLAGMSRKSTIPKVLGYETDQRVFASIGLALRAVVSGAHILRVHDVRATKEALTLFQAADQLD